jgi:branched-chain amino acid aminotransferase
MTAIPLAYVAGEFLPADQASVPISDLGLLQGVGAYETLRTYGGRPFRLAEHLRRLHGSVDYLGLRLGESDDQIAAILARLIGAGGAAEARLRITVTAGPAERAEAHPPAPATLIVTAVRLKSYAAELFERGAAVVIAEARAMEDDPAALHKLTSRVRLFLGRQAAHRAGAVEAIFLNTCGRLAEGAGTNVFIGRGGRLMTPPGQEGLMPGIARAAVLEVAAACGIPAEVRPVALEEFLAADEAMLTNSIMEVMPVVSVDGRPIADGRPGAVTRRLAQAYKDLVRRETGAVANPPNSKP